MRYIAIIRDRGTDRSRAHRIDAVDDNTARKAARHIAQLEYGVLEDLYEIAREVRF